MNTIGLLGLTFPLRGLVRGFLWLLAFLLLSLGLNAAQWRNASTALDCSTAVPFNATGADRALGVERYRMPFR